MEKIAVLIPCYNESKTVAKVVKDYKKALPEATIYVYDNNSSDHTDEIARKAGATVVYEYKQGKGNVIRSMFRDIDAECYIMIDGDDTYPAENAREMCDLILSKKADMVIGDRLSSTYFTENKRPFHNLGNKMVRFLINKLFHNNVKDIMTGYRAFSYDFVKGFPVLSKGFEIETEMTIHAVDKNYHLVEVPVNYKDRPEGSVSKLNTYKDGFKVLKTIAVLFKEYKLLFGFAAILVTALVMNLILGAVTGTSYFNPGFAGQPIAHTDGLWNALGMYLAGFGCILLGGCPLRQLILAGEGNTDSAVTVLGLMAGAAFAHNFGLASSGEGPTANGKIAVIIGIVVVAVIAAVNSMRKEEA